MKKSSQRMPTRTQVVPKFHVVDDMWVFCYVFTIQSSPDLPGKMQSEVARRDVELDSATDAASHPRIRMD